MHRFCAIGLCSLCSVLLLPGALRAQVKAFPEAEGFGQYATGARTNLSSASVYHVTNLNDSGTGSFRDAVSQSNRFVVFDVGGFINLDSVVQVASNVTIAGQTAPGGIVLYDHRISFTGSNNLISRHFAVRMGRAPGREDAASIARGTNMIFDHMSIAWGVDGTFDINPDSGYVIDNITIQDSIVAQGLDVVGHSTGGLMTLGEGDRSSVIRSLWADNVTRNPKVRGENEFINNVVYGYETSGYIMGDTTSMDSHANVEGNYMIEGPVNGSSPFASGTANFHIYANGNYIDENKNGVLDGYLNSSYPGADVVGTRFAFPTTTTMTAQQAVAHVMDYAGPSIVRDVVDTRLMDEVASYGTLGGVIVRETDLFTNYGTNPAYLNPRARLVDADNDGIADNWEAANGLSSSNANDWKGLNGAGYTRLEEYVNELGANGSSTLCLGGEWTAAANWTGGAPTLADDAATAGSVTLGGGHAFARRVSLGGSLTVSGGTLDVFDTATSNSTVTVSGGTVTAGRVLLASTGYTASVSLQTGGTLQTGTLASGGGAATLAFNGGTFRATGKPDISVPVSLGAAGGTIDTRGFDGQISTVISGLGGLTKQGGGNLLLSAGNTFSGPLLIQAGSVELGASASVSNASSINLEAGTTLDASALPIGLFLGSSQTLTGRGTVTGNVYATSGSVVRPFGQVTGAVHTIGVQAEEMTLGSDWALFDNNVYGTGNGGSYDGSGLFGGGIVLLNQDVELDNPRGNGFASATFDIPEAGTWYLFARVAAPSDSGVSSDPTPTEAGANNSLWVSGIASTLEASIFNYEQVQTPSGAPDAAVWVKLSPTLDALTGVWGAEDNGIDYSLTTSGLKTFAIAGREAGTILDGFVLTNANLDTYLLDAALSGSTGYTEGETLTVEGNYTQMPGAALAIEIDAADSYNKLTRPPVRPSLAGMLEVSLDGYQPQAGDVLRDPLRPRRPLRHLQMAASHGPSTSSPLQWDIVYDTANDRGAGGSLRAPRGTSTATATSTSPTCSCGNARTPPPRASRPGRRASPGPRQPPPAIPEPTTLVLVFSFLFSFCNRRLFGLLIS